MFEKLKSLFIEEDPNAIAQQKAETKDQKISNKVEDSVISDTSSMATSSVSPENIDAKFIDILMKAIESHNKEGFDYLEFKNSLQSLSKLDMDEATRFKSSFIMGRTMGLTKENLLQSVQAYIAVINQEEAKFKDALQKQKGVQVQGKEEQLKATQNNILQKEKQIAQMSAEIEQLKGNLTKTQGELKEAIVRIDATNDQFLMAHKLISQQMLDDIQKIKTYIE
ncbi:MAG: hypothetical protein WAT79_12165 [Saprospiraceae bacterium]